MPDGTISYLIIVFFVWFSFIAIAMFDIASLVYGAAKKLADPLLCMSVVLIYVGWTTYSSVKAHQGYDLLLVAIGVTLACIVLVFNVVEMFSSEKKGGS